MTASLWDVTKSSPNRRPGVVGVNLLRLRKKAGLSQEELGAQSGVHRVTIASLESGLHAQADMDTIKKLAKALDVDAAELISGSKSPASASGRDHDGGKPGSDPEGRLPPNVADFIRRKGAEYAEGELEFFASSEFRNAWPNLEFADDEQLAKLVKLHTGFALRATKRAPPR